MRWGAAPFPSAKPENDSVTIVNSDMVVIPRGAKHPKEAFEFIRYLAEQGPIEKLSLLHGKTSSLVDVSEAFFERHKNSYIRMFQALSMSKNSIRFLYMGVWNQLT